MKISRANKIVLDVERTYDNIAADFSASRFKPWKEMQLLVADLKPQSQVLDLGCGNGRLYQLLADKSIDYHGVDQSANLIQIAQAKYPHIAANFAICGATSLPFADASFDAVFMIAVLQHIPSFAMRCEVLREVQRVLKPGGQLMMVNWNLWDLCNIGRMVNNLWRMITLGDDWGDLLIPWKANGSLEMRYYHAFTKSELLRLCQLSNFSQTEAWGAGQINGDREATHLPMNQAVNWVHVWEK